MNNRPSPPNPSTVSGMYHLRIALPPSLQPDCLTQVLALQFQSSCTISSDLSDKASNQAARRRLPCRQHDEKNLRNSAARAGFVGLGGSASCLEPCSPLSYS